MSETSMVLGSVRGYRAWQPLSTVTTYQTGTLHPVNVPLSYTFKPADKTHFARCIYSDMHLDSNAHAPNEQCRCGFYAAYRPRYGYEAHGMRDMLTLAMGRNVDALVLGSVQLSGKVIFGSHGIMRGEKLEIEALLIPRGVPTALADKIHENYQSVPVVDELSVHTTTMFQEQYPLNPPLDLPPEETFATSSIVASGGWVYPSSYLRELWVENFKKNPGLWGTWISTRSE